MTKFTEIVGICRACSASIKPGDHYISASFMLPIIFNMQPPPPALLCAECCKNVAAIERKYQLEESRRMRLAEVIPSALFTDSIRRKVLILRKILMLQPRGPRLLVKRIDAPKPTSSLLVIPETVDGEKSCYAIVIAVGNKVTEDIKVADTVILASYCGSPVQVELEGEMLEAAIVMQDDVLAVVEE